jgi:hypothetical protein
MCLFKTNIKYQRQGTVNNLNRQNYKVTPSETQSQT